MKLASWIVALLTGGIISATLIVACSDDSPPGADAAVCDCDPAEPPLAGRIVRTTDMAVVPAGTRAGASGACPSGATLLGGGCGQDGTEDPDLALIKAEPAASGSERFDCVWNNTDSIAITGTATAICLIPAQ